MDISTPEAIRDALKESAEISDQIQQSVRSIPLDKIDVLRQNAEHIRFENLDYALGVPVSKARTTISALMNITLELQKIKDRFDKAWENLKTYRGQFEQKLQPVPSKTGRVCFAVLLRKMANDILTPLRNLGNNSIGLQAEIEGNPQLSSDLLDYNVEGKQSRFHDYLDHFRTALHDLQATAAKLKEFVKDPTIVDAVEKSAKKLLDKAEAVSDQGEVDNKVSHEMEELRKILDQDLIKVISEVLPTIPHSTHMDAELESFKPDPSKPAPKRWFMPRRSYCLADHLRFAAAQIAATSVYVPHEWPQVGESFSTWMNSIKRVLISPTMLSQAPKHLLEAIETSLDEYIDLFKDKPELDVTTEDLKSLRRVIDEAQKSDKGRELAGQAGRLIPKILKRIKDFVQEFRAIK